jgi:MOSC domain-containing protein YiiM
MSSSGTVVAIWLKRMKRGPMDAVGEAARVAGRGLVGNTEQGGRRPVTVLEEEAWAATTRDLGVPLPPVARRANLLVRGVHLAKTRERVLRVGDVVRLRVFTEVKPCRKMDDTYPGLQAAMRPEWRGGVACQVVEGGRIAVGDAAQWEE